MTRLSAKEKARRKKHRASCLMWRGKPPGMSQNMALKFERLIREGKTFADLTKQISKFFMVNWDRFVRHGERHPAWLRRLQKMNAASITKKKKRRNIGYALRTKKFCLKGLHPMKGDNVKIDSRGHRRCQACQKVSDAGLPMTDEVKDRIKCALVEGYPLAKIVGGKPGSLKIVRSAKLNREREIDPEFGRFVDKYIAASISVSQMLRHAADLPDELKPAIIKLARLKHKIRTVRREAERQ